MTLTKDDIKKWLKAIEKDRFWLAEQCGVDKRTVDSWFFKTSDIPPRAILIIQKLMKDDAVQEEGRILQRVETLTLQFSKDEWAEVQEYQKLNPGKTIQELAEEFVLDLTTTLRKNIDTILPLLKNGAITIEQLPVIGANADQSYNLAVIGNIAAGGLQSGDTIPYHIKANRPLGKGEYVLRVEGKSMEPVIQDGALVVMRRHTLPPIPKAGTIVQYDDERGVTLKKLGRRKNPETGKMEYVLHPLNPQFGDIEPMDGGRISGIYVTTLENWSKA